MKFILGKKLGMTQIFRDNGEVVPVTRVKAGPCQITQVKSGSPSAIQLGYNQTPEFRLKKPQAGHLKDLRPVKWLKDFKIDNANSIARGDLVTVENFVVGDKVDVIGNSKGRGFAGVVKRHGFKGGPASHGHKDNLRAPGSIGSGGVQRVFKGTRMAGRLGAGQVTVKNLEVVRVNKDENELLIKGALPGARNGFLVIRAAGELQVTKPESEKKVDEKSKPEVSAAVVEVNEQQPEDKKEVEPKERIKAEPLVGESVEKKEDEPKTEDKKEEVQNAVETA